MDRFRILRRLTAVEVVAISLAGAALIGYGVFWACTRDVVSGLALGGAGLASVLFAWMFMAFLTVILKIEGTSHRLHDDQLDIKQLIERQNRYLEALLEDSQLSDIAKAVIHRQKERETLRRAIREDISSEDWEAAYYLIDQMATRFGYVEEAERFREEVDGHRKTSMHKRVDDALNHIEHLINKCEWDKARSEGERLMRIVPEHEQVAGLNAYIDERREAYKQQLLREWDSAVERNDIDHAIDLLRELDQCLSREEARSLAESARTVFKEKLLNLGAQFRFAVTDKRWKDALETGLQIIEEFPNTRMAQEVQGKLDALRQRAGLISDAQHGVKRPAGVRL